MGKDIRTVNDGTRRDVAALINDLALSPTHEPFAQYETWYVWCPKKVKAFVIVFQAKPLSMVPGQSRARITWISFAGNILCEIDFPTGNRIDILDASFNETDYSFPCVRVQSQESINGVDVRWQYYNVDDFKVSLIRLEDSRGSTLDRAKEFEIGPPTDIGLIPFLLSVTKHWMMPNTAT